MNDKIAKLKQAMIDNDPRGRKDSTKEQRLIWYKSYDELETLLDEEAFENFIDQLD